MAWRNGNGVKMKNAAALSPRALASAQRWRSVESEDKSAVA
jgi:hypothetical protein